MAGTGANGTAEKVESRDKVNAHKRCRSGVPGAHIFATSIRFEGGENGPKVLHFVVPKSAEGLSVGDNWNTIGMRGTGSHDVFLKDVFVPDASIAARRPADQWHKIWNVVLPTALPLIMPAYVGIAGGSRRRPRRRATTLLALWGLWRARHRSGLSWQHKASEQPPRLQAKYGHRQPDAQPQDQHRQRGYRHRRASCSGVWFWGFLQRQRDGATGTRCLRQPLPPTAREEAGCSDRPPRHGIQPDHRRICPLALPCCAGPGSYAIESPKSCCGPTPDSPLDHPAPTL